MSFSEVSKLMVQAALVGIDIGTSSTKAVVMRRDGTVVGSAAREYPVLTPHPGWAEQHPEVWVQASIESVAEAMRRAGVVPTAVAGLSFSGQMHGLVCLDDGGVPLRRAIIWADQRSREQVSSVTDSLGLRNLARWTGNPLATGFQLASWLWLQIHEPEIAGRTRWLLLPKDYVRYRLTGEVGTEASDASSTSLFNPSRRRWSHQLLDRLEVDSRLLPPVHSSTEVAAGLLSEVAAQMGLPAGLPVVFGGSDQAVQALGNGVVEPGTLSSTIGTGGQLLAPTIEPVVDPALRMHCFCHVLPKLWHAETAMLSAGLSLKWLRDKVLQSGDYQSLADMAETAQPGSDGLYFLPYLTGERTPHMDPQARGCFVGLTRRHHLPHLVRAVMEGVVFGMRGGLDLMRALDVPVRQVVASGGATRHPLWLRLQADIYGYPIIRSKTEEAAAVGAAMLAGLGTGLYADAAEAVDQVVEWHDASTEPQAEDLERYADMYRTYCNLYPALRSTMHGLGDFVPTGR